MTKQVMESLEDLRDLVTWACVPPCALPLDPAGLQVGAVSLGFPCLSLL